MKSNYDYVSWQQRTMKKHGDDIAGCIAECRSPDVSEFIIHHLEQCNLAHEHDLQNGFYENDTRWIDVWQKAQDAIHAMTAGDASSLCIAFFNLGRSVESISHPTIDEQIKANEALIEKAKKDWPISLRNLKSQFLQDHIRQQAAEIWAVDAEKECRLSYVCEVLLDRAKEVSSKIGIPPPGNTNTLKEWLRPIAPEYASKAGRPSKNSR